MKILYKKRAFANQQYADLMKKAHISYAYDPEIGALYADALMIQHPWDLWNNNSYSLNGEPRL